MYPPVNRLVECALPVMRELAANADQSCHSWCWKARGCWWCCRSIRRCRCAIRWRSARISRFWRPAPARCCSRISREEREQLVERILRPTRRKPRATRSRRASPRRWQLGYEMRPSLAVEGCTNISMPIRDHTGTVIAALTVPFLPQKTARFDRRPCFERAAAAADQIRRRWAPATRPPEHRCYPGRRDIRSMTERTETGRESMNWSKINAACLRRGAGIVAGSAQAQNMPKKIGYVTNYATHEWYQNVIKGMKDARQGTRHRIRSAGRQSRRRQAGRGGRGLHGPGRRRADHHAGERRRRGAAGAPRQGGTCRWCSKAIR